MKLIIVVPVLIIIAAAGYILTIPASPQDGDSGLNGETNNPVQATNWREVVLKDVITGQEFRITDFEGEQVLIESFAVWCPTCLQQQKELDLLMESRGDFVHISLDTDPNEAESNVIGHVNRNNLGGIFAVAPQDVTQGLIEEFGLGIVNAPAAPVVLVCEDQSARFLPGGLKFADSLGSELDRGC